MVHKLIDIGHSRGVRIPKHIIQQANLDQASLVFEVLSEGLMIKPIQEKKRQGWAEVFQNAAPLDRDEIMDVNNKFDDEEWIWEEESHEKI